MLLLGLLLLTATSVAPPQGDPEVERLDRSATTLIEQGDVPGAVRILRRAVERADRTLAADDPSRVRSHSNLAWALGRLGQYDEALHESQVALDLVLTLGDPSPGTSALRKMRAQLALDAGRPELARALAERALADGRAVYGLTPMVAELFDFAARLAMADGDWSTAQDHLEWSAGIVENVFGPTDPERLAGPLHGLAECLAMQGKVDAALMLREHVLGILEEAGLEGGPAWDAHARARVPALRQLGEELLAGEAQLRADDPTREAALADPAERIRRALVYLDLGRPDLAAPYLEEEPGEEAANWHPAWLAARALSSALLGEDDRAAGLAEQALAAGEELGPAREELLLLRSRLLVSLGQPRTAVDDLLPVFRERRERLGEGHPGLLPLLACLAWAERRAGGVTPELIDFLDLAAASWRGASPAERASFARRFERDQGVALVSSLAAGWMEVAAARPAWRAAAFRELDLLRDSELQRAVAWHPRSAVAARPGGGDPVDLDSARAALRGPGDRLLLLLQGDRESWAWVVHPHPEQDLLRRLGPTRELQTRVQELWQAWQEGEEADLDGLAARVLAPVWEALEGATRVTLVADGALAWLPFEALPVPSGSPLVLQCQVLRHPTVAAFLPAPRPSAVEGAWLHLEVARPHPAEAAVHVLGRLGGRFLGVPGSAPAPLLSGVRPEGDRSVVLESGLRGALAAAPAVLRVHAPTYLDPVVPSATGVSIGPEDAAGRALWQFPDGFLDLTEIAALELDGGLVWHSAACGEFGLGVLRAGGPHGLARAWRIAGADTVLVTLLDARTGAAHAFDRAVEAELRRWPDPDGLWRVQKAFASDAAPVRRNPSTWSRLVRYGG